MTDAPHHGFDGPDSPDPTVARSDRVEVIRREEQVSLEIEVVPLERIRLEKFIVSEERTFTVTLRREEVRVVREPLDPDVRYDIPAGDDEPVFVLHEERLVTSTPVVAVERVWLRKERVSHNEVVVTEVRREQVATDRLS